MKQNMITFNNELFGQIRTITINDESYFIGKDVAQALGYADTDQAIRKHVDEDDKLSRRFDWSGQSRKMTVINESGMYSLIFGSKLDSAKQFKKWVTSEVLPTIRKAGNYIGESATYESIDYQTKFGSRRIRKTFNESTNLRETYDEYYRLSKIERDAKRIDNKDRIKATKIIINTIEEKIANEALTLRGSELLALQELLTDISKDMTKLYNKRNGGIKSAQTKRIAALESLQDNEEEYFFIDKHPFSNNYMYLYTNKGVIKSPSYIRWINKLNLNEYLPEQIPGVDFKKQLRIKMLYGHKEGMDTVNFSKSIIDQVSKYYNFDDSLVIECVESLNEYVDSYEEGYIYIKIENATD